LPDSISAALHEVIGNNPCLVEGQPWYQGDHSLFLQQGRPAIAVSSQWFIENMETQQLTHTPEDNLNVVDYGRITECTIGIAGLIEELFRYKETVLNFYKQAFLFILSLFSSML
ncbi:MAG: Zn-dependent exopeptidase M28, partial [Tannerellaceae bacterium]|jgi:aminopeptidase YwaD|nr:Zn-dependent exopeptidase M28 [Tannerellaceae bacterium]